MTETATLGSIPRSLVSGGPSNLALYVRSGGRWSVAQADFKLSPLGMIHNRSISEGCGVPTPGIHTVVHWATATADRGQVW